MGALRWALLLSAAAAAGSAMVAERRTCACLRRLDLGDNLGEAVTRRVTATLRAFYDRSPDGQPELGCSADCSAGAAEALVIDLYLGNVAGAPAFPRELRAAAAAAAGLRAASPEAPEETFVWATAALAPGAHEVALYADGLPALSGAAGRVYEKTGIALGAVYGAYKILELLGFTFLHPLDGPLPPLEAPLGESLLGDGVRVESPRWEVRGMHYHTQHPLEFTDVLNGLSIPMNCSTACASAASAAAEGADCVPCTETFDAMVPKLEDWFEWCAATRLNRAQWLLLATPRMGAFADSPERQRRLRRICRLANGFGLACGAVVPIADMQQHGWYMVNPLVERRPEEQAAAIRRRVDWIAAAGYDYLSTENGLSEFTHPDDELMLRLLNEFADYAADAHGLETSIKVHCSTGQLCERHADPRPGREGERLNFNFLPTHASPRLGVMPHSVQPFSLDDMAPVYGNRNFSDMLDYTVHEMREGRRQVIWYGESAYWVSVDIDVPLLLLAYGDRRVHDLRLLASLEYTDLGAPPYAGWVPGNRSTGARRQSGARALLHTPLHGQITFSSGWEWGYWANDLIAALGAWDPRSDAKDDEAALRSLLRDKLGAAFGPALGQRLGAWMARVAREQVEVYIYTAKHTSVEHAADAAAAGVPKAHDGYLPPGAEFELSRDEVAGIFHELDRNDDAQLRYREIKTGMASLRRAGVIDKRLWASELLAGADADDDDSVDEDEFWHMLSRSIPNPNPRRVPLSRTESDALFRQLDVGIAIFGRDNGRSSSMGASNPNPKDDADGGAVMDDLEGVEEEGGDENGNDDGDGEAFSSASKWKILGVEGDGLLHYGELQQGMKTLRKTGQVSPRLWASQLLAQADTDRNGAVDADEFYRILRPEPDPEKLMGLAYLSGFDTWAELPRRLGVHMTQGNKILATDWVDNQYIYVLPMLESLLEAASRWRESLRREVLDPFEALCEGYRNGGGVGRTCTGSFADFDGVVEEDRQCDLAADGDVFGRIAHRDRCAKQRRLLLELYASAYVTELRTEQVLALYRAQAPGVDAEAKDGCLEQSRSVIRRAEKVVRFMETYVYRVPAARIASWRGAPDPTAYRFTYLWAVSSLYFWWRDQGRAEARSPQARRSPCYLNRMDPSELAIGLEAWIMEKFKGVLKGMPRVAGLELGDCLAPPKDGFTFPDDL